LISKKKIYTLLSLLLLSTGLFFLLDLALGSVNIPIDSVLNILGGSKEKTSWTYIILSFRLPKAITAILVGGGLSIAGLQMQTLFRNPLAGPYVLGISSGASLGVAILLMAGSILAGTSMLQNPIFDIYGMVISAILGASLVLLLVVAVSMKISDTVSLLIIGIMFGNLTGAIVSILQYYSNPEQVQSFLIWTFGSLGGVTWSQLKWVMPLVLAGISIAFGLQKSLNALLLGENYAQGIGVSVNKIRLWMILSTSLIAGTLTAYTGPIAFIGVAVPHIGRLLFRTSDHQILMPAVGLFGALLMLICDIISQLPGTNQTLPINSVCAMFGAPVVIWVVMKSRNVKANF